MLKEAERGTLTADNFCVTCLVRSHFHLLAISGFFLTVVACLCVSVLCRSIVPRAASTAVAATAVSRASITTVCG